VNEVVAAGLEDDLLVVLSGRGMLQKFAELWGSGGVAGDALPGCSQDTADAGVMAEALAHSAAADGFQGVVQPHNSAAAGIYNSSRQSSGAKAGAVVIQSRWTALSRAM
jgi:hypothetical protein